MLTESGRFPHGIRDEAIRVVRWALEASEDRRWCNLTFEVDEEQEGPGDSTLFSFLAARGPSSPLVTVMGSTSGRRPRPAEVGIQHRAGVKAATQLTEVDLAPPDGWRVVQDHPRRGLVVALPAGTRADEVVDWLLDAMRELNRAPTTGDMLYELYAVAD